jgi:uncharacterized protein YbbK (DUF523 family)
MGRLPTPREPCDVVVTLEGLRVVGRNDSTIDYTAEYNKGAEEVLRLVKIFDMVFRLVMYKCIRILIFELRKKQQHKISINSLF